jgi:galactose mutarotase-like enzyme
MHILPSGLAKNVDDAESLSRFLTQSSHFNTLGPKPAAFLPNPKHRNSSVFRIDDQPDSLSLTWKKTQSGDRILKGVALITAGQVRQSGLAVESQEPPPAHANIEGWPWIDDDPELQKAQQLELAKRLSASAKLIRF